MQPVSFDDIRRPEEVASNKPIFEQIILYYDDILFEEYCLFPRRYAFFTYEPSSFKNKVTTVTRRLESSIVQLKCCLAAESNLHSLNAAIIREFRNSVIKILKNVKMAAYHR